MRSLALQKATWLLLDCTTYAYQDTGAIYNTQTADIHPETRLDNEPKSMYYCTRHHMTYNKQRGKVVLQS